jgi:hypothetical protein
VANDDFGQSLGELRRSLEELRATLEEMRETRRGLDEYVKLRYDIIKHNITLAAGVAVALIALSQSDPLPIVPLLLLAVSVIAGVIAMPRAAGLLLLEGEEYKRVALGVFVAHSISATTLLGAVLWYVVNR